MHFFETSTSRFGKSIYQNSIWSFYVLPKPNLIFNKTTTLSFGYQLATQLKYPARLDLIFLRTLDSANDVASDELFLGLVTFVWDFSEFLSIVALENNWSSKHSENLEVWPDRARAGFDSVGSVRTGPGRASNQIPQPDPKKNKI